MDAQDKQDWIDAYSIVVPGRSGRQQRPNGGREYSAYGYGVASEGGLVSIIQLIPSCSSMQSGYA